MGQKVSTSNTYTTTNVVTGDHNSVVPSNRTANGVSPSQSISPSTTTSIGRKAAGDQNPTSCNAGALSITNAWRDSVQALFAGQPEGLSHIARVTNALTGAGPSVKESLDNVAAINATAANTISANYGPVLRDMSHSEVSSKLKLMENGGSSGYLGGVYNVSDPNLTVEDSTAIERINSAPNTQGVSPTKIAKRSEQVHESFCKLREITELLSRPIGSSFSPNASELNTSFPGMPYDMVNSVGDANAGFEVPPDSETDPSLSSEIGTYVVSMWVVCATTDASISPVINTHSTNKLSSDIFESGPMRIIGSAKTAAGANATYYVEFILNRRAVSFSFPTEVTPLAVWFSTMVMDTTSVTLNIPADRVSGYTITPTTCALDVFGYISDSGASTGPGDIRDLWHRGTVGLSTMVSSIQSHSAFQAALQTVMSLLSTYMSDAESTIEQLALDLMTQVPKYPYTTGPIAVMINAGVAPTNIQWIVFSVLNLLDSLATSHAFSTDPAAIAYGNRLSSLAASRPKAN